MEILVFMFLGLLPFDPFVRFGVNAEECSSEPDAGFFYYFAYGSNMLPARMRMNCQTARNCSTAKLEPKPLGRPSSRERPRLCGLFEVEYSIQPGKPVQAYLCRLDFNVSCPRWNGAMATIVKDNTTTVWGNVWQISAFESTKLSEQQGVTQGLYYPKDVRVTLKNPNIQLTARVYIGRHPVPKLEPENLPSRRKPSTTYHQVMMLGAIQCHLPVSYLNYIMRFPTNGKLAPSRMREDLGYPFYDTTFT